VAVVLAGDPAEVEIHCHGGPAPQALVLEALDAVGAGRRSVADWLHRGTQSRSAADAHEDLARAPTVRAAEVLLEQAEGALDREIERLDVLARDDPSAALVALDRLVDRFRVGRRLVEGWRVVLAGRPNVGKSRLLNALAGYERAIVDPTPGTTRDIVTARTACDGWPVELADTAGLRVSDDSIEASGIALARGRQAGADLVVLVLDRSVPLTRDDQTLLDSLPRALRVANKADLPAAWDADAGAFSVVSAERGDGIAALIERIARELVPEPPPAGAGVPFRVEQVRALEVMREGLGRVAPSEKPEGRRAEEF
jgi:tRNA modification GTPase